MVRWDDAGRITQLEPLPTGELAFAGSPTSGHRGIRQHDVAIGTWALTDTLRPVRWDPTSRATELGLLNGRPFAQVSAINDHDVIVGFASVLNLSVAVVWDSAGQVENLGTLPGMLVSAAVDINDAGSIVGESSGVNGEIGHAVLWRPTG